MEHKGNLYTNPERSATFTDSFIYFISLISRRFCTYLDYVYVSKDSPQIYV